jgi:hypothetical protein
VLLQAGDVLHVSRAASVQFVRPLLFRVIRVHDWLTYHGWVWLDGYELNGSGDAIARRSIFVQVAGLRKANSGPWSGTGGDRGGRRAPVVENRPGPRNRGRQQLN